MATVQVWLQFQNTCNYHIEYDICSNKSWNPSVLHVVWWELVLPRHCEMYTFTCGEGWMSAIVLVGTNPVRVTCGVNFFAGSRGLHVYMSWWLWQSFCGSNSLVGLLGKLEGSLHREKGDRAVGVCTCLDPDGSMTEHAERAVFVLAYSSCMIATINKIKVTKKAVFDVALFVHDYKGKLHCKILVQKYPV